MALLSSLGILLASLLLSGIYYHQFSTRIHDDLWNRTRLFSSENPGEILEKLQRIEASDMRVTLIGIQGEVLYDNTAEPGLWEEHGDREEIREARELGWGESRRISPTLGQDTYYFSVRLSDGSVVRTARSVRSIGGVFLNALPLVVGMILLMMILSYFVSLGLAKRVVAPLGRKEDVPYDELAPFVRTITKQREQISEDTEELLRRSRTIEMIMDHMSEGVLLIDHEGQLLSINQSARVIFGSEALADPHSPWELSRDLEFNEKIKEALAQKRGEMILYRNGREYRTLISPVAQSGVAVFLLDITEGSRAERARREFSANVSHELRTPLTSIYGRAEMLKEGLIREEDRSEFYAKIMEEASRLVDLISELLRLSEWDEGHPHAEMERISLSEIAGQCLADLRQKAEACFVTLELRGEAQILGIRPLIYELLYNLMDNGIKYNRPGGSVEVLLEEEENKPSITVKDNGLGMSLEAQQRVFERFFRVEPSRSKSSGGTGLGLAIARHIAGIHGASITVSGKLGEGTTFRVSFPPLEVSFPP